MGNVGRRVRLLALDGRNAGLAGGFPSDPILSGPCRTVPVVFGHYIQKTKLCISSTFSFGLEFFY